MRNRIVVRNLINRNPNENEIIQEQFTLHYRIELNKILDMLISDINEIADYLKETMEPVSVLKQVEFTSAQKNMHRNYALHSAWI